MTVSDVDRIVADQRKRTKAYENQLFKDLNKSYRELEDDLTKHLESILSVEGTPAQVLESKRVREFLNQVRDEFQHYTDDVLIPTINEAMVQTSLWGTEQAETILQSMVPELITINTLPRGAIREFTRFLTTGPLGELFDTFGDTARDKARRDLLLSLTLGHNPRKAARYLKKSLATNYQRSLLIARTELLRAHREGNRQAYQRNTHLVKAWVWVCAASPRTCAACWAMHGRSFPLDEPMAAHPACRCSMVPKTKTWRELGYDIDEVAAPIPSGEALFAQQSNETQLAVLGKKQYERYKNGEVTLEQFVGVKRNEWGKTYTKKIPK